MSGWVAGAIATSAVVGAVASSSAASKQASAARDAAKTSADVQERMLERQIQVQQPWLDVGEKNLNRLAAGLAPGGEFATPFSKTQWTADPGYAFRLSEGMKALDRTAAARGGLLSGATLKGAQRYGQDLASQEYQNAFNRYYAERENMLRPIQSLAGVGQTTASQLGGAMGTAGANIGSTLGTGIANAGAAQAAGTMGISNAISGGLGQGLNYYQGQQLMNRIFPSSTAGAGGSAMTYNALAPDLAAGVVIP